MLSDSLPSLHGFFREKDNRCVFIEIAILQSLLNGIAGDVRVDTPLVGVEVEVTSLFHILFGLFEDLLVVSETTSGVDGCASSHNVQKLEIELGDWPFTVV